MRRDGDVCYIRRIRLYMLYMLYIRDVIESACTQGHVYACKRHNYHRKIALPCKRNAHT